MIRHLFLMLLSGLCLQSVSGQSLPSIHDSLNRLLIHIESDTSHVEELEAAGVLMEELKETHPAYYHLQNLRYQDCLSFYGYSSSDQADAARRQALTVLPELLKYPEFREIIPLITTVRERLELCSFTSSVAALDTVSNRILQQFFRPQWENQWPALAMLLYVMKKEDIPAAANLILYIQSRYKGAYQEGFEKFNSVLVDCLEYAAAELNWHPQLKNSEDRRSPFFANRTLNSIFFCEQFSDSVGYVKDVQNQEIVYAYLQVKEFLLQALAALYSEKGYISHIVYAIKDFVEEEMSVRHVVEAEENGFEPVMNVEWIVRQYRLLADLYFETGSLEDALYFADQGLDWLKIYTTHEPAGLPYEEVLLKELRCFVLMKTGSHEDVMEQLGELQAMFPRPTGDEAESEMHWGHHLFHQVLEVRYLAQRQGQYNADRMKSIIDTSTKYIGDYRLHQNILYPELYYTVALMLEVQGSREKSLNIISQLFDDEPPNGKFYQWMKPEILSLQLKLQLELQQRPDTGSLSQLLDHSAGIITGNFPGLHPEERLRIFRNTLHKYFDIYHTILANGLANEFPQLKDKMMRQSLILKKALSDKYMIDKTSMNEALGKFMGEDRTTTLGDMRNMAYREYELGKFLETSSDNNYHTLKDVFQRGINLTLVNYLPPFELPPAETIASSLDANSAIIEFVRYTDHADSGKAAYFSYLILPHRNEPGIIKLFREDQLIDSVNSKNASTQYRQLDVAKRSNILNSSSKLPSKRGKTDPVADLLFPLLQNNIQGVEELCIVPDGMFNLFSFAAMKWKGRYLLEHYRIKQLSSSATLADSSARYTARKELLLAGGIDYGQASKETPVFASGYSWNNLPGTEKEVSEIAAIAKERGWNPTVLQGENVNEKSFDSVANYRAIHIATHGYYFSGEDAIKYYAANLHHRNIVDDPNFRSGLLLSGANGKFNEEDSANGINGVMHGYELANTDFEHTELVVLSACETALGDIENNLGVGGLQRALKIAGARQILVSLWPVPDEETAIFMREFYQHYFETGNASEALNKTQRFMSARYDPWYWGAFVLIE